MATSVISAGMLLSGCGLTGVPAAPPVASVAAPSNLLPDEVAEPADDVDVRPPTGALAVAYPEPQVTWWGRDADDVAASDLASLWMLPLYRTDPAGRLVPALATAAAEVVPGDGLTAPDGATWGVRIELAAGDWSDGMAVGAGDVIATAAALQAARPAAWTAFVAAVADDEDVLLWFDRPYHDWAWLLSVAPGVLPAHVLADGGLASFEAALPVTGGWFTLSGAEPELRAGFEAHEAGPLGAPGLASVDVFTVPDHDVALGLLAADRVAALVGYVALDPVTRALDVAGATSVAAFGGTRFELVWDTDGQLDVDDRRAVARQVESASLVDGLLRDVGRAPGGVRPGLAELLSPVPDGVSSAAGVLQLPRTVEGLGLIARLLQAQAAREEVALELLRVDPPQHIERPVASDGRLRLARVSPGRSMAALLAEAGLPVASGVAADAAGTGDVDPVGPPVPGPEAWGVAQRELADSARMTVIAEVAAVHTWRPEAVDGLIPSGWPGVGLWNVGAWTVPSTG